MKEKLKSIDQVDVKKRIIQKEMAEYLEKESVKKTKFKK